MNNIVCAESVDAGKRLDVFLQEKFDSFTRNMIQNMIVNGQVLLDGQRLKKNYRMAGNENIQIEINEPQPTEILPEKLPLDIVYEDEDIIVVNKQRGMVVHPAAGNWTGTLVNALLYHCGDRLSGINGEIRPGIVHRIDKDTSGLLVVAKNNYAHQHLAEQISRHAVSRNYEAVLYGVLKNATGTINQPIARHKTDRKKMAVSATGKQAVTHYQVITQYKGYTHAGFSLETGRTHQIRVHCAFMGHPIIGDLVYGVKKDRFSYLDGQCLHAVHLSLVHPRTNKVMEFTAPKPKYFLDVLDKLR